MAHNFAVQYTATRGSLKFLNQGNLSGHDKYEPVIVNNILFDITDL